MRVAVPNGWTCVVPGNSSHRCKSLKVQSRRQSRGIPTRYRATTTEAQQTLRSLHLVPNLLKPTPCGHTDHSGRAPEIRSAPCRAYLLRKSKPAGFVGCSPAKTYFWEARNRPTRFMEPTRMIPTEKSDGQSSALHRPAVGSESPFPYPPPPPDPIDPLPYS